MQASNLGRGAEHGQSVRKGAVADAGGFAQLRSDSQHDRGRAPLAARQVRADHCAWDQFLGSWIGQFFVQMVQLTNEEIQVALERIERRLEAIEHSGAQGRSAMSGTS